jgi:cell division septation protein DedD
MKAERLRIITAVFILGLSAVVAIGCGGGSDEEEPAAEVEQPVTPPAEQPAATPAQQPARQPTARQPEPTVVREAAESPHGFYTIQLSSWKTQAKADREARRYQQMGLEAYTQRADIPGMGTWYRVRVGRYPALTDAQAAIRAMVNIEETWVDNFNPAGVPPGG